MVEQRNLPPSTASLAEPRQQIDRYKVLLRNDDKSGCATRMVA